MKTIKNNEFQMSRLSYLQNRGYWSRNLPNPAKPLQTQ